MTINPKNVDNVGGESNADLIFQLAIDDLNPIKDWIKIAEIVGNSVTPEAAHKWFESITSIQKKDRWTKEEESKLRNLLFPQQILKNEQICELFQNRSQKAVINKISRLRIENRSFSRSENYEHQLILPQAQDANPTKK